MSNVFSLARFDIHYNSIRRGKQLSLRHVNAFAKFVFVFSTKISTKKNMKNHILFANILLLFGSGKVQAILVSFGFT